MKLLAFLCLASALLISAYSFASEAPLELSASFDLARDGHKGPFFELMSGEKGIKAALDKENETPVEVVDASTFRQRARNFAHLKELEGKIKGGFRGLDKAVSDLAGKKIPMEKMWGAVMSELKGNDLFATTDGRQQSRLASALVPVIALSSGKGVLVQLDRETYCYNYGYAQGSGGDNLEADKTDRKTGRSYGASSSRGAYDPSDNDYLRELAEYTAAADDRELKKFYTTVFEILLKSDASGIHSLQEDGQTVVADFMAIYMAELDRHLMTGLKMYEWENALAEITMLAAYSASEKGLTLDASGLVASKGLKARDRLLGFYSVGTDGSGLDGKNKPRRHALTKQVVKNTRATNENVVARVEKLIGESAGADIYDLSMEFINNFKTQAKVMQNADQLIEALVDFVLATH